MSLELDSVAWKVLKAAYKGELDEAEYSELIGRKNWLEPNEVDEYLISEKLIDRICICAIPDGEGGFVRRHYKYAISRRGRAVVEQRRKGFLSSLAKALVSLLKP